MMAVKSISKLRGQTNHTLYPQPEGQLGECMTKYGKDLGEDSLYGMLYMIQYTAIELLLILPRRMASYLTFFQFLWASYT